jgi:hypothetical protein
MTSKVMRLWQKRRPNFDHDYALAGYLLSTNPTILRDAVDNKTGQHDTDVTRVIHKLFLDPTLVGQRKVEATKAELVQDFWEEWSSFILQMGKFADPGMWVIAANPM